MLHELRDGCENFRALSVERNGRSDPVADVSVEVDSSVMRTLLGLRVSSRRPFRLSDVINFIEAPTALSA